MKKYALLLAGSLLFVPSAVDAMVIEPGTIEIGAAAQLAYSSMTFKNGTETTQNQFGLDARGAYYVIPNLGVGVKLDYTSNEVEDVKSSSFDIGPIVKYQFPVAEQVNLYGVGSAGYQSYDFSDDTNANGWYAQVGAGASFFLSSSFSVDGLVMYTYNSLNSDVHDYTADAIFVGVGLSVYLR